MQKNQSALKQQQHYIQFNQTQNVQMANGTYIQRNFPNPNNPYGGQRYQNFLNGQTVVIGKQNSADSQFVVSKQFQDESPLAKTSGSTGTHQNRGHSLSYQVSTSSSRPGQTQYSHTQGQAHSEQIKHSSQGGFNYIQGY
jgi:hypothetical protein